MPYLIDGHNLIPHVPGLSLAQLDDEERLIERLQVWCRRERVRQVEVYFDQAPAGMSGVRRYGMVTAHFVRQGSTADDAIRRRLARLGRAARNWTVVSSDRAVQAAARAAHAAVLSSPAFAARLAAPPDDVEADNEKPSPDEDIETWLRLFGEGPDSSS